jgi:hypothetical protein
MALARWTLYYLQFDWPIRIILQTGSDPIVATLANADSAKQAVD